MVLEAEILVREMIWRDKQRTMRDIVCNLNFIENKIGKYYRVLSIKMK